MSTFKPRSWDYEKATIIVAVSIIALTAALLLAILFFPAQISGLTRLFGFNAGSTQAQGSLQTSTVEINGHRLTVEIADEPEEQRRGLSYRPTLARDRGMLFVFSTASRRRFWMRGMQFPLDFIFIRDSRVVSIATDVPANKNGVPAIVTSEEDADSVLEVNAGAAQELGINVGSSIALE